MTARRVLGALAASVLVLTAPSAASTAASAASAVSTARAVSDARTESTVSDATASACNPKASSLRPSGPPQVIAGSFMAKIRARGFLIAGVDQSTYHFGYLNPLDGNIEGCLLYTSDAADE